MNETTVRTPGEVVQEFKNRGCYVSCEVLGYDPESGGEIMIYAPGLVPDSERGFEFIRAPFDVRFDGSDRKCDVWLVRGGSAVRATAAEYENADKDGRWKFGSESSVHGIRYFVHRREKKNTSPADYRWSFKILGI